MQVVASEVDPGNLWGIDDFRAKVVCRKRDWRAITVLAAVALAVRTTVRVGCVHMYWSDSRHAGVSLSGN